MNDTIKEVLWEMSHLTFVSLDSEDYCLIVESTALNDFVEDHLWDEYQYQATSVSMATASSVAVYYNYLASSLPVARFIEALRLLNPNDVVRIYKSNI
jgi:hypothetical protein